MPLPSTISQRIILRCSGKGLFFPNRIVCATTCFLAVILLFTPRPVFALQGNAAAGQPCWIVDTKGGIRANLWLESSLKRVFPKTPPGSTNLNILASRNGRTSFQACVQNCSSRTLKVQCSIGDVKELKAQVRALGLVPMPHITANTDPSEIEWEVFAESLQDYAILQSVGIRPDDEMLSSLKSYADFPKNEEWINEALHPILKVPATADNRDANGIGGRTASRQ